MCCCAGPRFYKSRILLLGILACCEAVFGIFRTVIFFAPALSPGGSLNFSNVANLTDPIAIAFMFDWTSTIMGTFVGICVVIFLALAQCFCCFACIYACHRSSLNKTEKGACSSFFDVKALHRFISLDCNCPCYRARPKLRFRLRFVFLLICLGMRGAAIYIYYSILDVDNRAVSNFYSCAISSVFLILVIILDIYRYTVWWCYTPSADPGCCGRSKKHKRYIPYHIAGGTHHRGVLGDRPCQNKDCRNRHLSHVVVFHARSYRPQPRWSTVHERNPNATYIGFHTTTPKAAASIVHSEFRVSSKGMLGKGVYFARSMKATEGKAEGGDGACIVAEIRMGKVYECNKRAPDPKRKTRTMDPQVWRFVSESKWHKDFDTCYVNHEEEAKDEFCIKNPEKQIIKWVVVVDENYDQKVADYELDTEFDSTKCFCV